ncbi:rhodanese-like domain-containing protein [Paracoccaceae bacterium]|jgi:rhodanese-related sulfurtransferase|nr:rhodanese-like domain-containing protein [Paracoccaceae bacterium]
MKKYLLTVLALMLALPALAKDLSPTELMTYQSNGVVIVDIRRAEEWKDTGIINGAKTITAFTKSGSLHPDFQTDFTKLVSEPDTPFVLYCRSGRRTGILRDALETSMGFTKAMHLLGGIVGWKKDGKNLVNYTP